jgi:hypothetical protein
MENHQKSSGFEFLAQAGIINFILLLFLQSYEIVFFIVLGLATYLLFKGVGPRIKNVNTWNLAFYFFISGSGIMLTVDYQNFLQKNIGSFYYLYLSIVIILIFLASFLVLMINLQKRPTSHEIIEVDSVNNNEEKKKKILRAAICRAYWLGDEHGLSLATEAQEFIENNGHPTEKGEKSVRLSSEQITAKINNIVAQACQDLTELEA